MMARLETLGQRWWGLFLLFALPLTIAFFPLLAGLRTLGWGDDVIHHAAYFAFWQRALASGDSFLWNPDTFAGFPAFATAFGFFAPWNYLITALAPGPFTFLTVLPWLTVLAFALGAFFFAKFLQALGLSFWPSYLGGTAFTLSHQTDAFFMPAVNYHVLLPLLFLVVWKLGATRSWCYVLWGGLAVAFGWLAVNFQETFYILIVTLAFAGFVVWRRRSEGGHALKRFFIQLALIYLIGTAVGLIQILPTRLMAGLSTRAGGVSYAFAAEDAVLPSDFARWIIPDVKLPLGIPFGSRGSSTPLYMGIVPLFFFLYALADRSALARFFTWLFGAAVAVAIVYSPFFWLMTKLPVFSYFRVPDRWMIFAVFSASALAAFGVERFSRQAAGEPDLRLRRFSRIFALAGGVILIALLGLNVMFWLFEAPVVAGAKDAFARYLYVRYQPAGAVPLAHYLGIIDTYFGDLHRYFSFSQPIVAAGALALVASVLALAALVRRPSRLAGGPAAILALVTVLNLIAVKGFDYQTVPSATHAREPETVTFLRSHPGRAMPFLFETFEEKTVRERYRPTEAEKVQYRFAMLVPNTNLFYGIESAVMKDGLEPMAMSRLMGLVGAPVIGIPREFPGDDPAAAARALAERKPLLDFLGIRYLVSGYSLDERVFPVARKTEVTSKKIRLTIYENPGARPLVSLAPAVRFVSRNGDEIFRAYRAAGFEGIFADCPAPCIPGERSFGLGAAELLERRNTRVRLRTILDAPGFLVFSQNHLPGWRAFVDRREAPRHTVNTVFLGIEVPAGEHEIEFAYANPCGSVPGFVTCLKSLLP